MKMIQLNGLIAFVDDGQFYCNKEGKVFNFDIYQEDFEYYRPWWKSNQRELPEPNGLPGYTPKIHCMICTDEDQVEWCYDTIRDTPSFQREFVFLKQQPLEIDAVTLYLLNRLLNNPEFKTNNLKCIRSTLTTILSQGIDRLRLIGVGNETIGLRFDTIFIGVEHDGYAHS